MNGDSEITPTPVAQASRLRVERASCLFSPPQTPANDLLKRRRRDTRTTDRLEACATS